MHTSTRTWNITRGILHSMDSSIICLQSTSRPWKWDVCVAVLAQNASFTNAISFLWSGGLSCAQRWAITAPAHAPMHPSKAYIHPWQNAPVWAWFPSATSPSHCHSNSLDTMKWFGEEKRIILPLSLTRDFSIVRHENRVKVFSWVAEESLNFNILT